MSLITIQDGIIPQTQIDEVMKNAIEKLNNFGVIGGADQIIERSHSVVVWVVKTVPDINNIYYVQFAKKVA